MPQCGLFFTAFISGESPRSSPIPFPLVSATTPGHSLETHWPYLPLHQVGCAHYASSPTIPIPHPYSHLCSRPSTVVSPVSLPLVSRTYKDLSGTESVFTSCEPSNHPIPSPFPFLSVSSEYLETVLPKTPSGHTYQDLRNIACTSHNTQPVADQYVEHSNLSITMSVHGPPWFLPWWQCNKPLKL